MTAIISLIYLCVGVLAFTRKIKLFKVISSIVLYSSLLISKENIPLQVFNVSIILLSLITLLYINTSKEKKDIFYFSIPCWLLITSIIVVVFINKS